MKTFIFSIFILFAFLFSKTVNSQNQWIDFKMKDGEKKQIIVNYGTNTKLIFLVSVQITEGTSLKFEGLSESYPQGSIKLCNLDSNYIVFL
ncbi:MAG: hypothetical protein ABI543_14200 [Ignavibacteria bacterium]